jgi:hypothetical protein
MNTSPAIGRIMARCVRASIPAEQDPMVANLREILASQPTGQPGGVSDAELCAIADRYWPGLLECSDARTEMTKMSATGLGAIGRLAELAEPERPLGREARHRLCELALFAQERAGGKVLTINDASLRGDRHARVWAYRQYLASMLLALTVAVGCAVALATAHPSVAVALLAARIGLDMTSGLLSRAPTDLHLSAVRETPLSFRARYFGCVGSHVADAIMWSAFVVALYRAGSAGWAIIVCSLVALVFLGSLFRVGLAQIGLSAERSGSERVVRVGSMLVGLMVVASGSLVAGSLIALAPALVFGIHESLRAARRAWAQRATEVATLVRSVSRIDQPTTTPAASEMVCDIVNAPLPGLRRVDRSAVATLSGRYRSAEAEAPI